MITMKLFLVIVLTFAQISFGDAQVVLTCSFAEKTVNGADSEYTCELQSDYPFIMGTAFTIDGEHLGTNTGSNVFAFSAEGRNILQIPNLSTDFENLKTISIKSSTIFRSLNKENLAPYSGKLEYLAITNSEIDIIEGGIFEGFSALATLDLSGNKIFYIDINVFSDIPTTNVKLQENQCKNADMTDIAVCEGSACGASITSSSCGAAKSIIEGYKKIQKQLESDASAANEKYAELESTCNEAKASCEEKEESQQKILDVYKELGKIYEKFDDILFKINDNYTKVADIKTLIANIATTGEDINSKVLANSAIIDALLKPINDYRTDIDALFDLFSQINLTNDQIIKGIIDSYPIIEILFEKFSANLELTETLFTLLSDESLTMEGIILKLTQGCGELEDELEQLKQNYTDLESNFSECNRSLADSTEIHNNDQNVINKLEDDIANLTKQNDELSRGSERCQDVDGTCRFSSYKEYGYSCIGHNLNISNSNQAVNWTGEHSEKSLTNNDVKALVLFDLSVEAIPNKIGSTFTALESLVINNCGLKKLEKINFDGLEKLKIITLSSNQISTIDTGAFDSLANLKNLDLSENAIAVLPSKIFARLILLDSLNLAKNQLTAVKSDYILSTNVIKYFTAANNQLSSVDTTFVYRLRNSDIIDFSGNRCDLKFDKETATFISFYTQILKNC